MLKIGKFVPADMAMIAARKRLRHQSPVAGTFFLTRKVLFDGDGKWGGGRDEQF